MSTMSTRRLLTMLGQAGALVLLLLVAIAPVVFAADPTVAPGLATVEVDRGGDPRLPSIAALRLTRVVLIVVGVVAMQVNRKPGEGARRRRRAAWWACPACATSNAGDRDTCFACAAPRGGSRT